VDLTGTDILGRGSGMLEGIQRQPRGDVFAFRGTWSKIGRKHRVIGADAAPDPAQ
jgi:hypothetical protein